MGRPIYRLALYRQIKSFDAKSISSYIQWGHATETYMQACRW